MKQGTVIKVLNDVKCILPKEEIIPKYDIVTVINDDDKNLLVKNIFDSYLLIPNTILCKVIKIKKIKVSESEIAKIKRLLKKTSITADEKEYDPFGPQPFAKYGIKIKRTKKPERQNPNIVKVIQKAQIICSNMMNTENILESNKLVLASVFANLAAAKELNTGQVSKLLMLCNKLIASSVNNKL